MSNKYDVGHLIYDPMIYDGMNTHLTDLEFYKRWFPKDKKARILELCCGTGRLTIPIAREGYHITGLDHTPSMLEEAKAKAAKEGLEIDWVEGDMRAFDLSEKYDLIFIPFNSIHHLYENKDLFAALKAVKAHLKEGGSFLLDCFNPSLQLIVEGQKGTQEIAHYTTEDGRTIKIKQEMTYESSTQVNRIKWHHFIDGQFDSVQNLDMRMFFPKELDTYLEWSGFEIVHKFGDFDEAAFNDQSDKQIYVCRQQL